MEDCFCRCFAHMVLGYSLFLFGTLHCASDDGKPESLGAECLAETPQIAPKQPFPGTGTQGRDASIANASSLQDHFRGGGHVCLVHYGIPSGVCLSGRWERIVAPKQVLVCDHDAMLCPEYAT